MTNYIRTEVDVHDYSSHKLIEAVKILHANFEVKDELKTRTIDGKIYNTSFHKFMSLGILKRTQSTYQTPVICIHLFQRINEDPDKNTQLTKVSAIIFIDIAVQAKTYETANEEVLKLSDDISKFIRHLSPDGNIKFTPKGYVMLDLASDRNNPEQSIRKFILVETA